MWEGLPPRFHCPAATRSSFSLPSSTEWSIETTLLTLQITLHRAPCGADQSAEEFVDWLGTRTLYILIGARADPRAVYDAIEAVYYCEPAGSSPKLHLTSVGVRLAQPVVRSLHWTDASGMFADGLTKGRVGRTLLSAVSEHNRHVCKHFALRHAKEGAFTALKEFSFPNERRC